MNIFFLHLDPKTCAQMHCDKHVIKMILETCQLLCSAWHVIDPYHIWYEPPYKLSHQNHPCAIWVRANASHYEYLCKLGIELSLEYTYRYGKEHKSEKLIRNLYENVPPIIKTEMCTFPQAMPDEYKSPTSIPEDVIESYRAYYFFEKKRMLYWNGKIAGRETPKWIEEMDELFLN
tara:strand:+ start:5975 stop:6502 length:528 start_codon:yes stop_codon:yes gene_type:complete